MVGAGFIPTLVRGDQPPDEEWNKTFGGSQDDIGEWVEQTSDGGYIVAGRTGILAGWQLDALLIKTDANGNMSWNKTFGGSVGDWIECVQQTSDGGYILGGTTIPYGAGDKDWWLIKTDSNGNKVWDKTFGGSSLEVMQRAYQTTDGGYILVGNTFTFSAGGGDIWLIKTDTNGSQVWSRTFGGIYDEYGYDVQQTTDEGYIIAGLTYSYGAGNGDAWLIKTDLNGNKIWNRTFGGSGSDWGHSVRQTSDGDYIIGGATASSGAGLRDAWVIKTDSSGTALWTKTYGGSNNDQCQTVEQTSDGGYIISGTKDDGPGDFWLIKADTNGNELWNKTFGGSGVDSGRSAHQTSDEGYIIVGETSSFGAGMIDVWLIKVAPEGGGNQPPELYDDFEDGTLDKWNIISGVWEVISEGDNNVAHLRLGSTPPYRRIVSADSFDENIIITAQIKGNNEHSTHEVTDMPVGFYSDSGGNNYYFIALGYNDVLYIAKYVNGVEELLEHNDSIISEDNIWYNLKIKLENNDIFAKRWEIGDDEPSGWQISYFGATPFGTHILLGGANLEDDEELWFDNISVKGGGNQPPVKPNRPWGPTGLITGESGIYKTNTIDSDGDQIFYWFDWGDGSNSNWIGPYDSGRIIDGVSHSWDTAGSYNIKAKAKDEHDAESDWSDLLKISIIEPYYFVHITDVHHINNSDRWRIMVENISRFNPPPAFVILTGDIVDWGAGEQGADNFEDFITHGSYPNWYLDSGKNIPIYFSPGNHDYRERYKFGSGDMLKNYHKLIEPNANYYFNFGNTHVISLNSGHDILKPWWLPPYGGGLTDPQMEVLEDDLYRDLSHNKIIFMHHPAITSDNFGTINQNRDNFIENCTTYDVEIVLTGHTHKNTICKYNENDDSWVYDSSNSGCWLTNLCPTLYVQTDSVVDRLAYRNITVDKNGMMVSSTEYIASTAGGTIKGCPAEIHVYDSNGNHVGLNASDGIDFDITGASYTMEPLDENHTKESISVLYGMDNYTFIIKGSANGIFNFTNDVNTKDGAHTLANYNNVTITENSFGTLFLKKDSMINTIFIDDNGDGITDREILPDEVICDEVPYFPFKPFGPTMGFPNTLYSYSTNTTDPEGDQIYYLFDWDDGTDSGWLGPFDSEEICSTSHSWINNGIYDVKVRAKDIEGHISDWSNILIVIIDNIPPISIKTIGCPKYGANDEWVTSSTEFNLTATDDFSGINKTYYRIWYNGAWASWMEYSNNFTLTGEGEHYIEYYSVDGVWNIEEFQNQTHYVDDTSPSTSCTLSGTLGQNSWYTTNVTVNLTTTDTQSGPSNTSYRIDGGSRQNYTDIFTLLSNGIHLVEYYSTDMLGNTESTKSVTIKIDKTTPSLSIIKPEKGFLYICDKKICYVGQTIVIGWITVKANASDAVSGIVKVEFYVDNKLKSTDTTAPYEWKWNEKIYCKHKLKTIAYDQAGNKNTAERDVWVFNC